MTQFLLKSSFEPAGDQPQAISKLVKGFKNGNTRQTLLGVTGSGKTFTMANIIKELNKPTLILAHNKTLAAQLYSEFKSFFPDNAVMYFISYYDYYRPEAYIAKTDTFIEKDSLTNEEIERMRHAATAALASREDVIIIASVSCIFSLGSPRDYKNMVLPLEVGMIIDRDDILDKLVSIKYQRSDTDLTKGCFRVRGDTIDVLPIIYGDKAVRIELFGDEITKLSIIDVVTGHTFETMDKTGIYPATHYTIEPEAIERAIPSIQSELKDVVEQFEAQGKFIEAQRIKERTQYDVEMLLETGHCNGAENYSRHIKQQDPNMPPYTLIDFFPDDFLMIVDESHMTIPQLKSMHLGDMARKQTLVDYGFRLPSSMDNRPLRFDEVEDKAKRMLFVSATPGPYEHEVEQLKAEQIIRPTGLLDPVIEVRQKDKVFEDLKASIDEVISNGNKVLVTTMTKVMAESLTTRLTDLDIRVKYLHSDIDTLERVKIIRDFRLGMFDVLIGINLLREGLDIPEIELVTILDADIQGFLRSEIALIQTIGRAARNDRGRVIMYADNMTNAMQAAIQETKRRRYIQSTYNLANNIVPKTVVKPVRDDLGKNEIRENKTYVRDYESMSAEMLEKKLMEAQRSLQKASMLLDIDEISNQSNKVQSIKEALEKISESRESN